MQVVRFVFGEESLNRQLMEFMGDVRGGTLLSGKGRNGRYGVSNFWWERASLASALGGRLGAFSLEVCGEAMLVLGEDRVAQVREREIDFQRRGGGNVEITARGKSLP